MIYLLPMVSAPVAGRLVFLLSRTSRLVRVDAARDAIDDACSAALLERLSTNRTRAVSVRTAR